MLRYGKEMVFSFIFNRSLEVILTDDSNSYNSNFWNIYGGNFILKEHVVVQLKILPKSYVETLLSLA